MSRNLRSHIYHSAFHHSSWYSTRSAFSFIAWSSTDILDTIKICVVYYSGKILHYELIIKFPVTGYSSWMMMKNVVFSWSHSKHVSLFSYFRNKSIYFISIRCFLKSCPRENRNPHRINLNLQLSVQVNNSGHIHYYSGHISNFHVI